MKINSLVSMGDVLPPRKQTVVERLKRRFGHYRQHQNACLPRYEQAANGLYETQRQDTLLLKQRYLESKAKKAKSKSDHHRVYKEPSSDSSKAQLHSKSLKRNADDALSSTTSETTINDDSEKPAKIQCTEPTTDKPPLKTDIPLQQANQQQQSALSSFSVQIVQQFSQSPQTIQTNVTVQALPKPLQSPLPQTPQSATNTQDLPSTEDHLQTAASSNIECKQEKDTGDSDLCQFKANQASNNSVSSGGDRLSDTFPSIEFTDESGETVLHPDILNDLIEDVFTNSADIMKDFNFEDSVGSLKDQEEATKEIIETLKSSSPAQMRPFHNDTLPFVANPAGVNQQNGLFKGIPSSNETPNSTITSNTTVSVTSSSTSYYNSTPQRLQTYNPSLPLPNNLGLDFKLNEPSPAALTLKQLAEQHQNMQHKQQQLGNSPLNNRPQGFNQNNFASQMNPLRSNYLNGSNNTSIQNNSPKMLNSSSNMFNSFDQHLNSFPNPTDTSANFSPANCDTTMTQNNVFGADVRSRTTDVMADSDVRALQMKLAGQQQQQQKPPAYGTTRPLTHYSGNPVRHQSPPVPGQHRPTGRQFQNNPDMRLQMSQVQQQMQTQPRQHNTQQQLPPETHGIKQQQHTMMQQQTHPNMYSNYSPQQPVGNPSFHSSMSQSMTYSPQFTTNSTMNRPPPEYKPAHRNDNLHIVEQLNAPSQVMFNQQTKNKYSKQQRAPNVTITPDGTAVSSTHDWRTNLMNNQQGQFRSGSFNPQDSYGDLNSNVPVSPNIPLSPIYNQFRMPGNQIPNNRSMARPNMIVPPNHMMQRQRLSLPQQQTMRNPAMDQQHASMTMNSSAMNSGGMMGPMYSESQDMDRQDGSHLSLDFLDNIESSASDLLNFDQVMQSGAHYPILDDILGK